LYTFYKALIDFTVSSTFGAEKSAAIWRTNVPADQVPLR